jgi:hypothetical protein
MVNVILGTVLVVLGILSARSNWWLILDLLKVFLFLGLVTFGVVALIAGIRSIRGQ